MEKYFYILSSILTNNHIIRKNNCSWDECAPPPLIPPLYSITPPPLLLRVGVKRVCALCVHASVCVKTYRILGLQVFLFAPLTQQQQSQEREKKRSNKGNRGRKVLFYNRIYSILLPSNKPTTEHMYIVHDRLLVLSINKQYMPFPQVVVITYRPPLTNWPFWTSFSRGFSLEVTPCIYLNTGHPEGLDKCHSVSTWTLVILRVWISVTLYLPGHWSSWGSG